MTRGKRMRAMRTALLVIPLAVSAVMAGVVHGQSSQAAPPKAAPEPPPFAATFLAAERGRAVPVAGLPEQFAGEQGPRVVGQDTRGQQYAVAVGSRGYCLVGVHTADNPGWEVCGYKQNYEDLTVRGWLDGNRISIVVLQRQATSAPPAKIPAATQIAPGLWEFEYEATGSEGG